MVSYIQGIIHLISGLSRKTFVMQSTVINEAPAKKRKVGTHLKPIRSYSNEDTPEAPPDESENLVYLTDEIFCNVERTQLYRLENRTDKDGNPYKAQVPIKTRWGMPVLEKVYQDNPRDDEKIDNHTYYTVRLSGRPNQSSRSFTHYQVENGKWAASFAGIAIAKHWQKDMYANVIFEQQDAFRIPLEIMPEHTGFQLDEGTGNRVYVLRTGEHLHEDGRITGNHPPLAHYSFDSESHTKHLTAWQHYEPLLPTASKKTISDLLTWDMVVDPTGNRLLLHLFAYRSLVSSIVPIGTAIIAAAKDGTGITDGGSGAGKTSAIDHARGIDGATPYQAEPDAQFNGSVTGIETRVDPLRDCLVSISDFHFNTETPSEHDMRTLADKFDAFIRSVADNGEIKARGTKHITAAQGTRIKAGIVFDGEVMPNLFLSRLRRAIVLQFERGMLDIERIKNEWWDSQGLHTANGRAVITWVLAQGNKNLGEFVFKVQQVEQYYAGYLLTTLQRQRPTFDAVIARSLSNNYARLLTPIWLFEQAIGPVSNEQKQIIIQAVMRSLCTFADMIDNGGPSQITRESMLEMITLAMEHGEGYVLAMDNSPLHGAENDLLNRWGYERTGLIDTPWKPGARGVHLANLSEDGETLWFRPEALLDIIKKRAKREYPSFPYNQQTFPAFLVRLGIAEKAKQKNLWRERFNGALEYRLRVSTVLLYSQDIEDAKNTGNTGNTGNSDTSPGSTGLPNVFPVPVPSSNDERTEGTDRGNSLIGSTGLVNGPVPPVPSVLSSKSLMQEQTTNIDIWQDWSQALQSRKLRDRRCFAEVPTKYRGVFLWKPNNYYKKSVYIDMMHKAYHSDVPLLQEWAVWKMRDDIKESK